MIPRRDIKIYGGLFRYFFIYSRAIIFRKNFLLFFEDSLKKYFSKERVFVLNSGRSSLRLIFEITKTEKGDEIIVPNYYLKELVPLLELVNLSVVFSDINSKHLSLDLEKTISCITPKTKFVILPHTFGVCQDIEKFISTVKNKKEDIIIIEDCAHAFGAEYKHKKLGTFGDFSFFSFDYIKPLNLLGGGALIVNSDYYKKITEKKYSKLESPPKKDLFSKIFRYYISCLILKTPLFLALKILLRNKKTKEIVKKIHKKPSLSLEIKKMSNFQAMLGFYQLKLFDKKQKEIEDIVELYKKNLKSEVLEKRPSGVNSKQSNYSLFLLTNRNAQEAEKYMFKEGVDVGIKDELMDICIDGKEMESSQKVFNSIFQIPLYCSLRRKEIKRIADTLNRFYSKNESY